MQFIEIPTTCPVCGSILRREQKYNTEILICPNNMCGSKLEGRVIHFVGHNGLDIDALSVKTVRKLIELGWITKLSDVFRLKEHRDEWITMNGFGENSVDKIIEGIPLSIELWKVIASAGITNIEKQTSILIADHFKTWENFRKAIVNNYDFDKLSGIGRVTLENLLSFDYSEIDEVMNYLTIKENVSGGKLENMIFCITGKLSMKRDELVKIIEQNGGKVGAVNKNLSYLICNDKTSNSGKSKKAKELDITIISEEEFKSMI